jgi:hypothetical protein
MTLTQHEIEAQKLAPETLATLIQQIKMDGYIVLEKMLPAEFVRELHANFMTIFGEHVQRSGGNRGTKRYQMHLPFAQPFIDPRVIANPLALQIIDGILGGDCVCQYFASDTPMPGSDFQDVHSDIHLLFPESDLAVPAYCLVLNINLVDFREDNGPLEVWPGGTHLMPGKLDMKTLAPRMTSKRVLMPAGSMVIRDLRMWHRGTPNTSTDARPNLAMIYARHWLRTAYPPISIAKGTYEELGERAKKLFRYEKIGDVTGDAG